MSVRWLSGKILLALGLAPVLALVFALLMTAAFSLPDGPIVRNIGAERAVFSNDKVPDGRYLDLHTECAGLSVGLPDWDQTATSPFKSAMLAESVANCPALFELIDGAQSVGGRRYYRYWHGYAILTRPALSIMSYDELRSFVYLGCLLVFAALVWRLGRDFGAFVGLAFAVPFLVVNAFSFWLVATKAVTWLLMTGGALFMSRRDLHIGPPPLIVFFLLGALTAYFDFLTTPLLVLILPAIVYFLYATKARADVLSRTPLKVLALVGVFWFAGYVILWSAKFAIAGALFGAAAWNDIAGAIAERLRGEHHVINTFLPGAAIVKNFNSLKSFGVIVAVVLYVVSPFATRARRERWIEVWTRGKAYLVLALAPLLWLEIVNNHSQVHSAFTNVNLAPWFIVAGLVMFGQTGPLMIAPPRPSA